MNDLTKFQEWIKAQGFSHEKLARRLDVSQVLVHSYATGRRPISDSFRWKFAIMFGYELAKDLLGLRRKTNDDK